MVEGVSRHQVRMKLDEELGRPLDPQDAEHYDRENWGTGPEAILAAQQKETLWANLTYGEEVSA